MFQNYFCQFCHDEILKNFAASLVRSWSLACTVLMIASVSANLMIHLNYRELLAFFNQTKCGPHTIAQEHAPERVIHLKLPNLLVYLQNCEHDVFFCVLFFVTEWLKFHWWIFTKFWRWCPSYCGVHHAASAGFSVFTHAGLPWRIWRALAVSSFSLCKKDCAWFTQAVSPERPFS